MYSLSVSRWEGETPVMASADNHIAITAALFVIAGLGFLAEKTRLGAQLTGAVIVILGAVAAANLGLIPHAAPALWLHLHLCRAAPDPLFLFQADLRRIFFATTRTTLAFLLASAGTVAGVTLAVLALDLSSLGAAAELPAEQREAAIAGLFASTYIGGAVNYAALGEITGLRQDASFFSAATATDNLYKRGLSGCTCPAADPGPAGAFSFPPTTTPRACWRQARLCRSRPCR